jgi:UDP-glucose 4-epimerase
VKCLVTGGAGFIGSHIVDKLLDLGNEVIVIDNESSLSNDKFYWNPKAKNYIEDVSNYSATKHLYKDVDYVFHLAAKARMQPAINDPIETVKTNTLGTITSLECAKENNVKRFIYSSTSSAYGNNPLPQTESYPNDCLNIYSSSKTAGENFCKIYSEFNGLKTIILRYFNVYGDRQPLKGDYAPVVGLFLKQHKEGKPLTIVGDGTQRRDFTNVFDIVDSNILAATLQDLNFGSIYNVGCGKNYSIIEIAKMISNNIKYIEKRPGEAKNIMADTEKISMDFGWKPKISLEKWIMENK